MKKAALIFFVTIISLAALFVEASASESELADYDLSGVEWKNIRTTYDGTPKCPELVGLPDGVEVVEYIGGGEISAGEYTVSARLSYDEENYNAPIIPECTFIIEKRILSAPTFMTAVYNGRPQLPSVDGCLFSLESEGEIILAGKYQITVKLLDPDNYAFVGGGEACLADFTVLPRSVKIKVWDMNIHLFEKVPSASWSVLDGSFLAGDLPLFTEYVSDGRIYLSTADSNYSVTVVPGRINKLPYPTLKLSALIFIPLVSISFLSCALIRCVKRRRRKKLCIGKCEAKIETWENVGENRLIMEENKEKTEENAVFSENFDFDFAFSVNAARADELITDSLAKSLVRRERSGAFTLRRKRCSVNVDTISANFSVGQTVDIGALKEKKLVPADATYLKVLARGAMDKPLTVCANAFTLTAVKMIALSGGEAVRITGGFRRSRANKFPENY